MSSSQILTTTSLLGLGSSLWLSGIQFASSHLILPILFRLPTATSTDIFTEFYHRGLVTVVPLYVISPICSGAAAYLDPTRRIGYIVAAVCTFACLPWTRLVMARINERLIELHKDARQREKAGSEEVGNLLRSWQWMNHVRALLGLAGGVAGLATYAGIV